MTRTITVLVAALVILGAVQPAAAQSDTYWDGLITEDDDGIVSTVLGTVGELLGDWARTQDKYLGEEDASAQTYADDVEATFNENNETLETYANDRLTADEDHDVAVLYLHDREGGNVSVYLVSNVSDGNWTNARAVNESAFEQLNRSTDFWISMDWFVSKHAADQLETFVDEYAAPDENLTTSYRMSMVSKYGSGIKSDLWNNTSPSFEGDS